MVLVGFVAEQVGLKPDMLAAGRLVAAFAGRVESGNYYWSVTSERGAQRENVIRFIDWLRAELASSVSKWRCEMA